MFSFSFNKLNTPCSVLNRTCCSFFLFFSKFKDSVLIHSLMNEVANTLLYPFLVVTLIIPLVINNDVIMIQLYITIFLLFAWVEYIDDAKVCFLPPLFQIMLFYQKLTATNVLPYFMGETLLPTLPLNLEEPTVLKLSSLFSMHCNTSLPVFWKELILLIQMYLILGFMHMMHFIFLMVQTVDLIRVVACYPAIYRYLSFHEFNYLSVS